MHVIWLLVYTKMKIYQQTTKYAWKSFEPHNDMITNNMHILEIQKFFFNSLLIILTAMLITPREIDHATTNYLLGNLQDMT